MDLVKEKINMKLGDRWRTRWGRSNGAGESTGRSICRKYIVCLDEIFTKLKSMRAMWLLPRTEPQNSTNKFSCVKAKKDTKKHKSHHTIVVKYLTSVSDLLLFLFLIKSWSSLDMVYFKMEFVKIYFYRIIARFKWEIHVKITSIIPPYGSV